MSELSLPENAVVLTDIRVRFRQIEVKEDGGGWINIDQIPPSSRILTMFPSHRISQALWKVNKKKLPYAAGKLNNTIIFIRKG